MLIHWSRSPIKIDQGQAISINFDQFQLTKNVYSVIHMRNTNAQKMPIILTFYSTSQQYVEIPCRNKEVHKTRSCQSLC